MKVAIGEIPPLLGKKRLRLPDVSIDFVAIDGGHRRLRSLVVWST
ncbi:MAG: hypothetical protein OXI41_13650 [Chloroflexota bacterium]|nr:hypothetical protein [Chloroflexota bacterium]MDE2896280.1 hypothetical protein [Chloroflexota bacterium]